MSRQIVISFAVAAIGISCIATDASARGGGRGGHGGGGPMAAVSGKTYNSMNTSAVTRSYSSVNTNAVPRAYNGVNTNVIKSYNTLNTKPKGKFRRAEGVGGPTGNPNAGNPGTVTSIPRTIGAGGPTGGGTASPTGGGAAAGARYYAPTSYDDSNTVCGRYPYPPCKKVLAR